MNELLLQGLVTALAALPAAVAGTKATMNGISNRVKDNSAKLDKFGEKLEDNGNRITCLETKVDLYHELVNRSNAKERGR